MLEFHIQDTNKRLLGLIKPEEYYPLQLLQVGSHEAATRKFQNTARGSMSLGRMLKRLGVQVIFSVFSWQLVLGKEEENGSVE